MDANATQWTEIRVPPFWPERPDAWFSQADAQFSLAGITNETTKFHHVISQLGQGYAEEVDDLNHLGDLLRIWVRAGATPPRSPLPDFQGPRGRRLPYHPPTKTYFITAFTYPHYAFRSSRQFPRTLQPLSNHLRGRGGVDVGTSHMSDNRQMFVSRKRLVDPCPW
jgi:hypothetical protein